MVQAVETNLQELLEGTKQYQVPLYQRTYSWKKPQLERLWEDLVKLTEDRRERGAEATHFIGSLVLAPTPRLGPAGLSEYLIVDGQQRMTTLTLLLAAIRDHRAATENPSHRDRVNEKYLFNKWEEGQPTKILPTQADRGSYLACIHNTAHAGDADPIGAAYRFFRAQLVEVDDPDDDLDVERLEDAVIAGLSVVCVTAQAGDNVHRIFESLNNTGLRLTQGDLIRNYIFMRLPTHGDVVYRSHWLPLQERLDSQQLELLFWLDLVQSDGSAKQSNTYALQQARMDRLESEEDIEAEVERFGRLGRLLELILDPSKEADAGVREHLSRLNAWGTTTVYPLLLHLLDRRANGDSDNDKLVASMLYLESFFVRRVLIGKATANVNRILLRAVQEVRGRAPIDAALRDYLSTGRKYFASDAGVRSAVQSVPFYWTGKAPQRKLILQWLEETYGSKEPIAAKNLTIEHVLPQTLTDEWRNELADGLEDDEDLETVFQGLVHTIGNLTLTGYNSELSNSAFGVKRQHLSSSGIRMNQEIGQESSWGRDEILRRSQQLAGRIVDRWPGPNPSAEEASVSATWAALAQVLAEIPAGSWTTYGDVAAVIGTHPVPLGQRLANHPAPNAHRVLTVDGSVSQNFRWLEPERTDSPRAVLEDEGVEFDEQGRAAAAQRLHAEELATLAGMEIDLAEPAISDAVGRDTRNERFIDQLTQFQPADVVAGTREVLDAWVHLGGALQYGSSDETSCFVLPEAGTRYAWPFTIYPSGRVEVVFQHMASRPPFDDVEIRHQFRRRLELIPGVDLPASKIELRPSFPLSLLRNEDARGRVIAALAWFLAQVNGDDAMTLTLDDVFEVTPGQHLGDGDNLPTDRGYWESGYGSPSSLAILDDLMGLVREQVPSAQPKYNKYYIGITQDGVSTNFATFRPRKDHVIAEFKIPLDDGVTARIEGSGLEHLPADYWSNCRLSVRQDEVERHRELLAELTRLSHQHYRS